MQRRWHWLDARVKEHRWTSGVELGVLYGQTLAYLLQNNQYLRLIGVDIWEPTADYPGDRQEHREACYLLQDIFPERLILIEADTADAHIWLADASHDFVFVDADHSYSAVCRDLELYRPKVRPGGFLCGHDYGHVSVSNAIRDTLGRVTVTDVDGVWYYVV